MNKIDIINQYIRAYNGFDIPAMLELLDPNIHFQNVVEGEINLSLLGKTAFREQAAQAAELFSKRTQTVLAARELDEETVEVDIAYSGTVALDLPNGLRRGQEISTTGKSVFTFNHGKIIALIDKS